MPASINKVLALPAQALQLHARRAEILAANLANVDTPHFKARDIDFKAVLNEAHRGGKESLRTTQKAHIGPAADNPPIPEMLYRVPNQSSIDGNTVDTQLEQAQFAQNAVRYQAALTLLNGRIKGLLTAIRGE